MLDTFFGTLPPPPRVVFDTDDPSMKPLLDILLLTAIAYFIYQVTQKKVNDPRQSVTERKVISRLKCFKRCFVSKRLGYVMRGPNIGGPKAAKP